MADSDTTETSSTDADSAADTGSPIPAPATDVSFVADFVGKGGPFFITGTIALPPGAAAGRFVRIEVSRVGGGNQLGPAGRTVAGTTLTFKVTGLEKGSYKVGAAVDQTNNEMLNDPGDYIGFARGTAAAPKMSSSTADVIAVSAPVSGVDFALGVLP